jgi:hypothetical protein
LWITGPTFTLFAGSHSGYERLPESVRHRRFLFHLHGSFSLIRDIAEGRGSHFLETSWHFAPDLEVSSRGSGFVAACAPGRSADLTRPDRLTLFPIADTRWKSHLRSEDVSPAYGAKLSAPVVRCSARVELPAEHAVLLIPGFGDVEEVGEFFRDDGLRGDAGTPEAAYRYRCGDTTHALIFHQAQHALWNFGPWTSDAKFLYFCVKNQRLTHVVFCEVSSAHLGNESFISHGATLQWLEWTNLRGGHQVACSDETASRFFTADRLDAKIVI